MLCLSFLLPNSFPTHKPYLLCFVYRVSVSRAEWYSHASLLSELKKNCHSIQSETEDNIKTKNASTHAISSLTATSFITEWTDQSIQEERASKSLPLPKKVVLILVQGVVSFFHCTQQYSVWQGCNGVCVSLPPPSDPSSFSERVFFHTRNETVVLHFSSVESIRQMWSLTQRTNLLFSTCKCSKTPVFHTSPHSFSLLLHYVQYIGLLSEAMSMRFPAKNADWRLIL